MMEQWPLVLHDAKAANNIGPVDSGVSHSDEAEVVLSHVWLSFSRTPVVRDVSFTVRRGELFGILGPSGSGKSTTLRIIAGFLTPAQGDVWIQGEPMGNRPPHRRNTSMVFQSLALFPHMTVFDNVAYGLRLRRVSRSETAARVAWALDVVHLSGYEARLPRQLSGGEQQRVALARALVVEPAVVLFDEALGSLDMKLRREMQGEVKRIQRQSGRTFIYVTHDQEEAISLCDRIAIMNGGRIEQVGTPSEVYERPATAFVAEFIGEANLLDGRVVAVDGSRVVIDASGVRLVALSTAPPTVGTVVTVSIRPERVTLVTGDDEGDALRRGRVIETVYTGPRCRCWVRLEEGPVVRVDGDVRRLEGVCVGDVVAVMWRPEDAWLIENRSGD